VRHALAAHVVVADVLEKGLVRAELEVDDLIHIAAKRYQAASESAEIQTHNSTVQPAPEKSNANLQSVAVAGPIGLPLLADWDYGQRAHLLVSLAQVAKTVTTHQKDAKKTIPAQIAEPTALLKNPEAFRADLTKLWLDQARAFVKAAQSLSAPPDILQCEPPRKVSQQHISLEEVGLSLPLSCRLDVAKER
jgi:hypothetical protein